MSKASSAFNNERHEILKLLTNYSLKRLAKDIGISLQTLFFFKEGTSSDITKRKIRMFLQRKIKD